MNVKKNDNIFLLKNYNTRKVDINFEVYKGELYFNLLNSFINDCVTIFNQEIFSFKKNYIRTITNLLSGWFFYMYSKYDFTGDYFFPNNYQDNEYLKKTIRDYCSINLNFKNNFNTLIELLIKKVNVNYKNILKKLEDYKNTNIVYHINISKIIIEKIKNKKLNFSYKFILHNYSTNLKQYNNILNNILLPKSCYNKLKKKYTGDKNKIDDIIFILLLRYQLLGSNNNQLSILPNNINNMKKDFNLGFELFGSSINCILDNYCSIYYDIEKYFGSKGSFFNLIPLQGTYTFNPPYQDYIITKGINHLLEFLEYGKKLCFILTIPIWDNYGKNIMEKNNKSNNNNVLKYDDFEIMKKVRNSKFLKGIKMIYKDNFTYFDHNFELYKNTTIQNTYIIVLSNFDNNYFDIINKYNFHDY
jgi:hypothetical protein